MLEIFTEIIEYIILGFVQGVTEVLPVSSSGHVTFVKEIFNTEIDNSVLFLLILNLGSIIAIIYYLRKDICVYIRDLIRFIFKNNVDKDVIKSVNYVRNVFVGILPVVFIGFFVSFFIESIYEKNPLLFIGIGALLTATILYAVRNFTVAYVNKEFSTGDSFFIGLMQVVSLFPGLSRLGVTAAAGVKRKLSFDSALKFSFMMLIPISFGSMFLSLASLKFDFSSLMSNFDETNYLSYIYYFIGFFVSMISTYYALKFVFILFRRGNLSFFYIYNFIFGIVALAIGLA